LGFSGKVKLLLEREIQKRCLPSDFMSTVQRWYLPLAQQITKARVNEQGSLLVSFNGAQGSGKSTLTAFLKLILTHHFKLNTVEISIDDFYLTKQQRLQLAGEIHPLLETRGVPGTHDIKLAVDTINCLRRCSKNNPCRVPQFDKACDDRKSESDWPVISTPVDIILFEGWCNHAPVQTKQQLDQAVNELEQVDDHDGLWRSFVNDQLEIYHRQLFDQSDLLIYLQVPSFEKVYEWRGLQERKLSKDNNLSNQAVMNEQQLKRFIQHYERITRSCLEKLPDQADIVLILNDQHAIEQCRVRRAHLERSK